MHRLARLIILSAALSSSTLALAELKAEPSASGRAVSISGRVLIRNEKSSSATSVRELKPGDSLFQGDVINTRSDATAKILMNDKTIIDLGASTLFKVDEFLMKNGDDRTVELSMGYGKVRAAVNTPVGPKGKYTVKTKAATMGVRGTEFIISSDVSDTPAEKGGTTGKATDHHEVKTQITVIHGKVEVKDASSSAKGPVAVTAGKQFTTVANMVGENTVQRSATSESPKVVDVPATQMKSLLADSKLQDQTFKQATVIDTTNKSNPGQGLATMTSFLGSNAGPLPSTGFGSKPADLGLPGTFGPQVGQIPVNVLPPGAPVNLTVTFVRR